MSKPGDSSRALDTPLGFRFAQLKKILVSQKPKSLFSVVNRSQPLEPKTKTFWRIQAGNDEDTQVNEPSQSHKHGGGGVFSSTSERI